MNYSYISPINSKDEFLARIQVRQTMYQKNGFSISLVRDTNRKEFNSNRSIYYTILGDTVEPLSEGRIYDIKCMPEWSDKYRSFSYKILEAYEVEYKNKSELNSLLSKSFKQGGFYSEAEILEDVKQRIAVDKSAKKLVEIGMNYKDAKRFALKNGANSHLTVERNPYILLDITSYVTFEECDVIANKLQHSVNSPIRIIAAVRESIKDVTAQNGNTYVKTDEILPLVKTKLDYYLTKEELKEMLDNSQEDYIDYQVFNFDNVVDMQEVKKCYQYNQKYPFFEITKEEILDEIASPNSSDRIVYDDLSETVILEEMDEAEDIIAESIMTLSQNKECLVDPIEIDACIKAFQNKNQIKLSKKQIDAVKMVLSYGFGGFYVINGPAGTGKTTVVNAIIYSLNRIFHGYDCILMAPTGRASQVLSEATGYRASTIHKTLNYNPDTDSFYYNATNKLKTKLIVVDETSMLDTMLCADLFKAIDPSVKVIFLGDDRQLPSVAPGKVLSDILETYPEVITLDEVKRNSSGILMNAMKILDEEEIGSSINSVVRKINDAAQQEKMIISACKGALKRFSEEDIEVLVPMKKYSLGINHLNNMLQPLFNPSYKTSPMSVDKGYEYDHNKLCIGDKVINVKNMYSLDRFTTPKVKMSNSTYDWSKTVELPEGMIIGTSVMNGEIGKIIDIRKTHVDAINKKGYIVGVNDVTRIVVQYPSLSGQGYDYVFYDNEEDALQLAYAITIHKSQGSTFPCTITCIGTSHGAMPSNELLYVAATRASKLNCFVINDNCYLRGVKRYLSERNTYLAKKIKKTLNK